MKTPHTLWLSFVLVALSACAVLGVPNPETFNQRAASTYTSISATRLTAAALVGGGVLSKADGANVQEQADAARGGVDLARQIHANAPQAGEDRLQLSIAILTAIQTYLDSKKVPQ